MSKSKDAGVKTSKNVVLFHQSHLWKKMHLNIQIYCNIFQNVSPDFST